MCGETVLRIAREIEADPSLVEMSDRALARHFGIAQSTANKAKRAWRRGYTYERLYGEKFRCVQRALDADPSLADARACDIAKRLDVSESTVRVARRAWQSARRQTSNTASRCRRCTLRGEPANPIDSHTGLCLLCRLDGRGIAPLTFFEQGGALTLGLEGAG